MSERVGIMLRRRVIVRANHCCEYCGMPDNESFLPHEPDHIIATQYGGKTDFDNLAYTCFQSNRYKGPNIASVDPDTQTILPLFNPRTEQWDEHFRWNGPVIEPLTAIGRTTSTLLRLNDPDVSPFALICSTLVGIPQYTNQPLDVSVGGKYLNGDTTTDRRRR